MTESQTMKPLFIPLRGEYFDAFARGEKTTEYRLRGPRWNAETCRIGREVILSRGYGKTHRLYGRICGFSYNTRPDRLPGWVECYGKGTGDAACIRIVIPNMVLPFDEWEAQGGDGDGISRTVCHCCERMWPVRAMTEDDGFDNICPECVKIPTP